MKLTSKIGLIAKTSEEHKRIQNDQFDLHCKWRWKKI